MLYLVATPIGHLEDITLRALETLRSVEVILCEDTRVTSRLLARYEITTPCRAFHEHTAVGERARLVAELAAGKTMALVTDAGTPGLSDPGGYLVADAVAAGVKVVPIPGASAAMALVSVAGLPLDRFTFLGFPPNKKGRRAFFEEIASVPHAVILYESTHRIIKALEALAPLNRPLVVGRELTKIHETIYRGSAADIMAELAASSTKGEFVIIVGPARR
jgi:16S rRNA (cytidine1402-2'-O)-methyltransferase